MKADKAKKMQGKRKENKTLKSQRTHSISSPAEKSEIQPQKPDSEAKLTLFSQDEINTYAPKIVMKDGKLVIEEPEIEQFDAENQKLTVVTNQKPKLVNSLSFRKKQSIQTKKWSDEETRKFFTAIEIFGSDATMVSSLFPSRDIKQIKNKFRKEERDNPERMEKSFKKHKLSGKKALKDRIKSFGTTLTRGDSKTYNLRKNENNNSSELMTTDLARNTSASSIDSMEAKVMDELQGIIVDIHQQNKKTPVLTASTMVEEEKPKPEIIPEDTAKKEEASNLKSKKKLLLNI